MAPRSEDLINPGTDILGTTQNEQGTILAQTGDAVGEEVHSDGAEWWQHVGFASRPAKAIAGKSACQGITFNQGSNDIIIASRDLRGSAIYGTLRDGETCLYAPGPSNKGTARVLLQDPSEDGSGAKATVEAAGTKLELDGNAASLVSALVNLGGSGGDKIALAPALQTWASNITAAVLAIAAKLNAAGPVIGAPGTVPATPALEPTVASSKVKASR